MNRHLIAMSHTHGDHMKGVDFYKGDARIASPATDIDFPPPAWLVADWMLDQHRGRPISERASRHLQQPTTNPGLLWLRDFLQQS